MYIKELVYKNVGPIRYLIQEMPFSNDGLPKPLIIVGENGSGKSLFVSHVVDALVEAAAVGFSDVRPGGISGQYFKIISPAEVSVGERYLGVHIAFDGGEEYLFKTGNADFSEVRELLHVKNDELDWKEKQNFKGTTFFGNKVDEYFKGSVYCYFGPNRYEAPSWMGDKYLDIPRTTSSITSSPRYDGMLGEPIIVQHCLGDTQNWLLDIVSDSRSDVFLDPDGGGMRVSIDLPTSDYARILSAAAVRALVERVLSVVLDEGVRFSLTERRAGNQRLSVIAADGSGVVSPSFNSLSTGQLAIFDLFSTIVRYADRKSVRDTVLSPDSIEGIVVIDEADLHLHTALQRTALPQLIKLFPRIQFVITTHSPLFLIGLSETIGEDGFTLIELPEGDRIDMETFSEYRNAYECYKESGLHRRVIQEEVEKHSAKPLVVTEGKTDWMHLKAARKALENTLNGFEWEDFDLLESEACRGGGDLKSICLRTAKLPQVRPVIFVADSDDGNVTKDLGAHSGHPFKSHGNGVYSLVLPKPSFREQEDGVCIEQMYEDSVLRTLIPCEDGISRRLFTSNEFDDYGRSEERYFWLGAGRVHSGQSKIISADTSRVVSKDSNDNMNYVLSKTDFAQFILDNATSFSDGRFKVFVPVFASINEAIRDWRKSQAEVRDS